MGAMQRPNIILIVADDMGYGDLGAFSQGLVHTHPIWTNSWPTASA